MLRGHVEKRGKKYYTIVFEKGLIPDPNDPTKLKRDREYISTTITDKRLALKRMEEIKTERATGTYVQPSKITLAQFLDQWVEAREANLAPATYRSYRGCIDTHIAPGIGSILLVNLAPSHLESFYAACQRDGKLSSTSTLYLHRILNKALKHAVKHNLVQRNVAELAEPPKKAPPKLRIPTLDEVNAIWQVAAEPYKMIIQLAVLTGMRQGEILGLRWSDIENGCIMVNRALQKMPGEEASFREPKRDSRRVIVMPRVLVESLARFRRKFGGNDNDLIFVGREGQPLHGSTVYHAFVRYAKQAGVEGVRFHDLRHAHATLLLGQSLDPKLVSDRLGHQSVKITLDTYSHVTPGMQGIVATAIDRLVGRRFGDDSGDPSE